MKKLLNAVSTFVPEMLGGLVALNPGLSLLGNSAIVVRSDARAVAEQGLVALISGGGSGHEPAHGGYVGPGLLTAAVAGEVFTSPSTDAVLDAIRAVAGPGGVLLIVKNYTGDRLNFGLAAEIARAEGIAVDMVVVADDVALSATGAHAGRRGLAGTIFVHKLAGAAAAAGKSLAEVAAIARAAAGDLGTMGIALSACTVPAVGKPGFQLAEGEVEWGLGIHGEAGVERGDLRPADATAGRLLARIIADLSLQVGDRVALLVNNLGGTPASELSIVAGAAVQYLQKHGLAVERAWAGGFLTALDMAGCSLSLLKVNDERLALLDAPAQATAWPSHLGHLGGALVIAPEDPRPVAASAGNLSPQSALYRGISAVCAVLIEAEGVLTDMDQVVGDGDLGVSLSRAAHAIQNELNGYPTEDQPGAVLRSLSATVRRVVGGTSGPLYAILLLRAAMSLGDSAKPSAQAWAQAFAAAVAGVREVGGAGPGDRTMLDALIPAAETFAALAGAPGAFDPASLGRVAAAAAEGAERTAAMAPRVGRSSYVGDRVIGHKDPGAEAVALWLRALISAVTAGS